MNHIPDDERFSAYANFTTPEDYIESDMIKPNFLLLNVNLEDDGYTKVSNTEKFPVIPLVGSLGGILNLWIGITFVTFIEIADLLYQLIANKCKAKDKSNVIEPISEAKQKP